MAATHHPCRTGPLDSLAGGDESYERRGLEGDPEGVYVLAFAVAPEEVVDHCRSMAKCLQHPTRGRFHFAKEDRGARLAATALINSLPLELWVVVRAGERKPERARGICLSAALWLLHGRVDRLILEARSDTENTNDSITIRGGGPRCCTPIVYSFIESRADPFLWLADAAAGTVFHARARGNDEYLNSIIASKIKIFDV